MVGAHSAIMKLIHAEPVAGQVTSLDLSFLTWKMANLQQGNRKCVTPCKLPFDKGSVVNKWRHAAGGPLGNSHWRAYEKH